MTSQMRNHSQRLSISKGRNMGKSLLNTLSRYSVRQEDLESWITWSYPYVFNEFKEYINLPKEYTSEHNYNKWDPPENI